MQTIQDRLHLHRLSLSSQDSITCSTYCVRNGLYVLGFCSTLRNASRITQTALSSVIDNRRCIFRPQVDSAQSLPFHAFLTFSGRPSTSLGVSHMSQDCRLLRRARAESCSRNGHLIRYARGQSRSSIPVTVYGGGGFSQSYDCIFQCQWANPTAFCAPLSSEGV